MVYPGGKNGAGTYQKLINLIPPHDTYIETHLGGGAILENKIRARVNIGIDIDQNVVAAWQKKKRGGGFNIIQGDAVDFLRGYDFKTAGVAMVYCDPPYLIDTRKTKRRIYRHEYTKEDHIKLLETIKTLACFVMISGYACDLYNDHLSTWFAYQFESQTRSGRTATETVWTNYPEPVRLHDYSFLGDNFRERERIQRKKKRWVARLEKMPILERRALLDAMQLAWGDFQL